MIFFLTACAIKLIKIFYKYVLYNSKIDLSGNVVNNPEAVYFWWFFKGVPSPKLRLYYLAPKTSLSLPHLFVLFIGANRSFYFMYWPLMLKIEFRSKDFLVKKETTRRHYRIQWQLQVMLSKNRFHTIFWLGNRTSLRNYKNFRTKIRSFMVKFGAD